MKKNAVQFLVFLIFLPSFLTAGVFWEDKPFTEWTAEEALRILTDSPWTREFKWRRRVNLSGYYSTNRACRDLSDHWHREGGAALDVERDFVSIVRVRLFSECPIRQAQAVLAAQENPERLQELRTFATQPVQSQIIISLSLDSEPKGSRAIRELDHIMRSVSTPELAAETYLATDTGVRVPLKKYIDPSATGGEIRFVFPASTPDGKHLLAPGSKSLKFQMTPVSLVGEPITINATFNLEECLPSRRKAQ